MKKVSARQANHDFSELLSRVERGEDVACALQPPLLTPER
jgi:antitoxin (DNA-binding transcriptional repressor) of toxin-antitoxin stability system